MGSWRTEITPFGDSDVRLAFYETVNGVSEFRSSHTYPADVAVRIGRAFIDCASRVPGEDWRKS